MLYTENFKKQVVKKVLSPGVIATDVCRKLNIGKCTVIRWKKKYANAVKEEILQIDINSLLQEEEIDVESLLRNIELNGPDNTMDSNEFQITVDEIFQKGKLKSQYLPQEKYSIVMTARKYSGDKYGVFLRKYGFQSENIKLWEEELLAMCKTKITTDDCIKKLEDENKSLKKQLKESQRDKHELEVLIALKKKYQNLFVENKDE